MGGNVLTPLDLREPHLVRAVTYFASAGKIKTLVLVVLLVAAISISDSRIEPSLGVFYIVPMTIAALALGPLEIVILAGVCAVLRLLFDYPGSATEAVLRFLLAAVAYTVTGLFVTVLVRNREVAIAHLAQIQKEQGLRKVAEDQLRVLVESSPAGILTLSENGVIVASNTAADNLFAIQNGQSLIGRSIRDYLPVLADALQFDTGSEPFHTAAQCQAHRQNGEIFLAQTWFSTYGSAEGKHLAAIVVDGSEEMREREEQNLQQLSASSRIMAGAVSHEIRNLCGAISLVYSNLRAKQTFSDEHFQALGNLVQGLERIASLDLQSRMQEALTPVPLQQVLDNLRILIEEDWVESGAVIHWNFPKTIPWVLADSHGLLQVFLNIVQNSYRAMQGSAVRELKITASIHKDRTVVHFEDTGPGVAAPEKLFQPFQNGADSTGLGLYVSRAILRSYGAELRLESCSKGACFAAELQTAHEAELE
jgi:two-component system, LuxR family, sensor kinase FixL